MATFNKEELLKIAHLSALPLDEHEVALFTDQISTILSYVDQLQKVHLTTQAEHAENVNILRNDVTTTNNAAAVLAQAPEVDESYFAVPKILEEK